MAATHSSLAPVAEWWLSRLEEKAGRPQVPVLPRRLAGVFSRFATHDLVAGIQLIRLRRTLAYAAQRSPFYRKRFGQLGIDPRQVRSLADLRQLPFTTGEDLSEPERFLCVPWAKVGHVFSTSGTTGEPTCIYFTFQDLNRSLNLVVVLTSLMPADLKPPRHVVALIALPQGLWIGCFQAQRLVERIGGLALAVGLPEPEETLRHIARFRPNTLISSPSYLGALTRVAEKQGLRLAIPYVLVGGEMLRSEQEQRFTAFWGAQVLNSYGTTEIGGGQAISLPGCHGLHLNEMHVVAEIVDPETGAASDQGELVFTTLARAAMPLLRYRTGDIGRWSDCQCGLPLRSIVVEGRVGDMFVAGGLNINASVIAAAVENVPGATGRVDIILEKAGLTDRLELRVERLPGEEVSPAALREPIGRAYPELRRSQEVGALDLAIDIVDRLEPAAKSFRLLDRRR